MAACGDGNSIPASTTIPGSSAPTNQPQGMPTTTPSPQPPGSITPVPASESYRLDLGWVLEDPALIRLFERLMNRGTPLGEFVKGHINYGIKTGLNEAFVIDQAKRDELIEEDPQSAELH